jgi:diacylglycerol kinase (ATP)
MFGCCKPQRRIHLYTKIPNVSAHHSPFKSKGGLSRVTNAVRYSAQGLRAALRHEAAFRQELILALVLTPLAFWVGKTSLQIMALIASMVFVLVVELLNSAIEAVADAVSLEENPLLGRAKDLGSAAVLLSLLLAAGLWLVMFINHWHPVL